jgi:ABC-type branched-subunit amino acid transport system ATPase component/ABC-type branched-subunit amino acid transport system permease subunit
MEVLRSAFDFSDFPRVDLFIAAGFSALLLLFPILPHSSFAMATMIQFLMFSVYGMGWNTIGGYGGQVDLGKAQYVGIGAYTTAVLLIRWDIPFWVSMPIGVCFAVTWSFIIGYPLFRLKGHYFAIATIATSLVLKDIFEVWDFVGAARGLEISPVKYHPPDLVRLIFRQDIYYYYVILGFFFLGILYVNWFRKSQLGYQLRSIKDNEHVAQSLGINVHWAKIKTYAIATAFVSVVGSFHACYIKNIEPEDTMSREKLSKGMARCPGGSGRNRSGHLCSHYHAHLGCRAQGYMGHCGEVSSKETGKMKLLELQNVTKDFGGLRANEDISFTVEKGELVGLIGPNGAGKTTLFNCIAGLHPVTSGRITFDGRDITKLRAYEVARLGLSRTFQVYVASGDLRVLGNVMVGCFMRTRSARKAKARAEKVLDDFRLGDLADYIVSELPVAAQKRVAMATAVATDPKILLLDEVAAGLNPSEIEAVMAAIRFTHGELGVTVMLIEHVMELVMNVSERVIVLDYGRKIAEGHPESIAKDPNVIKAYLGERYAQEYQQELT